MPRTPWRARAPRSLGPGLAGALIKVVGAPLALLVDAVLLAFSARSCAACRVHEVPRGQRRRLADGEVLGRPARPACASSPATGCWSRWPWSVGAWQACHHAALVVQILFATRTLGLSEQAIGLSYTAMGAGTILASVFGNRISRRVGPGPSLVLGIAICGAGWLLLAVAPANALGRGRLHRHADDVLDRRGADLHQLPGAAPGGDAGAAARPHDEHDALADPASRRGRARCSAAGWANTRACAPRWRWPACGALLLAVAAMRLGVIRNLKSLPEPERESDWLGAEADVPAAAGRDLGQEEKNAWTRC